MAKKEFTKLSDSTETLKLIMEYFKSMGLIDSYYLGERNKDSVTGKKDKNAKDMEPLFDEFDDEDFSSGQQVNVLISILRPSTLGASLQITGEGSRFAPDFVGCVLASVWEKYGCKVMYETYFVDNEYRPNPKDFFPDEQLFQFTLIPS